MTSFDGPNVTYTTTTQRYEDPAHGCNQDVVNSYTNFVANFPDGSKKYFPGLSTLNNPQPTCIDGGTNKSTEYYHASDASGYYLYVTNYNQWYLWGPDGSNAPNGRDNNGNGLDDAGRTPIVFTYDSQGHYEYLDVLTPSGSTARYTFTYTTVYVNTQFGEDNTNECSGTLTNVLQSIQLPDLTSYSFVYDTGTSPSDPGHYGLLTSMTLPSGAQITYTWANVHDMVSNDVNRWVTSRTTPDGIWQYTPSNTCSSSCLTEEVDQTVTKPSGDQIFYRFNQRSDHEPYGTAANMPMEADYYSGSLSPSHLVKTYQIGYAYNIPVPTTYTTILPQSSGTKLVSKVDLTYYPNYPATGNDGQGVLKGDITAIKEYDFGSGTYGPLLRETDITYLTSSPYFSPGTLNHLPPPGPYYNITDKPILKVVKDGSGNTVAQTQYSYDGSSLISTASTPAPNHDYTNFSTSFLYRGNPTSVSQWRNTDGAWLTTTFTYDDLGNRRSQKDPNGNTTIFDYTDNFSDGVNRSAQGLVTTTTHPVTNGVSHIERAQYFWGTAKVAASCGQNFPAATACKNTASFPQPDYSVFTYDWAGRPLTSEVGDTGQASWTYNGASSITKQSSITSSMNLVSTALFDTMGRTKQTQLTSDPQGTVYVDTTYDVDGRTASVSNPYRSTGETTYGTTGYTHDGSDRITTITNQDGSTVTTTYNGKCTTVTDEVGSARQSCVDGLGRLTTVFEDPGSSPHLNYETDYTYDTLNNLLSVVQKGSSSASARTRTFTYNSLSQLLCSANPEVQAVTCPVLATGTFPPGAITYGYDNDGNLLTKATPLPNQSSASTSVTTSYTYDALNRMISKSYKDGSVNDPYTPTVQFGYDAVALTGCTTTPPSAPDSYPVGRRTAMCDGSGAASYTHDQMGRILRERRTIGAVLGDYENDSYNLDGSPATFTTLGYQVTYTYSGAGRPITASNYTGGTTNFVKSATYAPPGELTSMTLGSTSSFAGIVTNNAYNDRLQPILLSAAVAGQNPVFSLCFDFHLAVAVTTPSPCSFSASTLGDNGNAYQVVNNRDNTRSETLTYDSLNRISSGQSNGTQWGETFTIDAWSNLTNESPISGKTNHEGLNTSAPGANNQLSGFGYDAAGNMTSNGSASYVYDAENRLIATTGTSYIYDGDGQRVEKCTEGTKPGTCASGATGTLYWRGQSGDALSETDLAGNVQNTYIFFNGQRVARRDSAAAIHYYFSDHLGSHGVVENATGTSCEQDIDYYPYGGVEHDYCPYGTQNYKFTGKERDSESGLDNFEARYDASSLGRFMTPDPMGGYLENPQSLNKYAYVLNNPTSLTDPTGLDSYLSCTQTKDNASTCQSQTVGYDKNGVAQTATVQGVTNADKSFTATQIGNDANGNLVDKTTGTGSYTASANGSGVQFSNNGGQTSSTGVFVNGTPQNTFQDAGFANGGALSGFTFTLTNSKLEAGQTEAGSFTFAGTPDQAGAALQKAGFDPRSGENVGMNEYRSPGSFWTGANSAHFNVFQIGLKPWLSVPQAQGDMHFGEHDPKSVFGGPIHFKEWRQ
jgi:RHS repeat-associated protein